MKKSALLIVGLLFSVSAFAETPNYSDLSQSDLHLRKFHKCLCDSWKAAAPTDAQSTDAKPFIQAAKDSWTQNKDALIAAKKGVAAAWSAYPISSVSVETAELAVHDHIVPVHVAMRNNTISILNLLSADQRKAFDASFVDCIHGKEVETSLN